MQNYSQSLARFDRETIPGSRNSPFSPESNIPSNSATFRTVKNRPRYFGFQHQATIPTPSINTYIHVDAIGNELLEMVHGTLLPRTLVITWFEASCKSINNCGSDPRTVDGGAQPPPPRIQTKRTRENRASARTANESHVMRDKPQTTLPRIETDAEGRSPSIRHTFSLPSFSVNNEIRKATRSSRLV